MVSCFQLFKIYHANNDRLHAHRRRSSHPQEPRRKRTHLHRRPNKRAHQSKGTFPLTSYLHPSHHIQGHQVAPAELEAHLLAHPAVNDCAVIQIPDERAGEIPKAFVVKAPSVGIEENDRVLARQIQKHVEDHKAKYKWITGGIEFIDVIPKSPSGKILRRMLRDMEKEKRRKAGSKL